MSQPTTLGAVSSTSLTGAAAVQGSYTGFTYTVSAGSNRLLRLYLGAGEVQTSAIASAVTYGGQTMTEAGHVEDGAYRKCQTWYLKEAGIAAASNTTFNITFITTSDAVVIGAQAWQGVDQTTSVGTAATASGSSTTPSSGSITLSADQVADGVMMCDDNNAFASDNTELFRIEGLNGDVGGGAEYRTTTGALTWTIDSNGWTVVGVPLNGVGGGGASPFTASLTLLGVQ